MNDHQALTPTVPLAGSVVMSIYAVFVLTGYFRKIGWYRFLMFLSMLTLGYGGVVKHIFALDQSPEFYYSVFSELVGIMIDVFGVVLNLIGATGRFRITTTEISS